ncbi:MAG: cytochrome c biogenesis CcdA family protein [bacterium]|nr:cytochrome c biogenesis CcdA family protein [bacterium]
MEQNSTEPNSTPPVVGGGSETKVISAQHEKAIRFKIAMFGFFLFIVFVVGLFWMITTPELTVGLTLSFVAGLSMIFLPCTLPLAFVIVPLTMGKDPKKGLFMALSFTLGLTITLSLYGVFIAAIGKTFGLKSDAEVYAVLLGGFAAFIFGLSEVGLLKFKLPSYSGNFPGFIQRQKDYMKTFLLGLLLGNAGVGCPNPAFYLLLGYIATTGDLFNGWFLGFIHGMGRSVPLIFLAILGTLGVNALSGVAKHKEGIQKVMGWMLLIIGAYLLTFGIFGHDWFIASGIHSGWEQFVVNVTGARFGENILKHEHKLIDVVNFIQYGNMFFLGLLAVTILAAFVFRRPSRRTMVWLSVTYIIIALIIGYSTAWTFKLSPNMRMQHGATAPPSDAGGGAHTGGHAVYHEEGDVREGVAVNFNVSPVPVVVGTSTQLDFFVNQKPGNVPIDASQLQLMQTKIMHVIGVRDDMNEFFHIHPQPTSTPGVLTVPYIFSNPGNYKIWSEISKDGTDHIFGHPQVNVGGQGQAYKKEIVVSKSMIVGGYQVTANYKEPLAKQRQSAIAFEIHDSLGREIEVEQYLAADIHMTIIKDDWKQFIHAHSGMSMTMSDTSHQSVLYPLISEAKANGDAHSPDQITAGHGIPFSVVFPEGGLYRMYAQFRPKGIDLPPDEALTAMFWVQVSDQLPSVFSTLVANWWLKLIISVVLITLLSLGIKKMLNAHTAY